MTTFLQINTQVSDELTQQLFTLQQQCFSSFWSVTQIAQQLSSNRGFNFALMDEQQLIGFLYCHCVFDEMEILQVAISPSKRGQGLGRKLISELLTFISDTNKQLANTNSVAVAQYNHAITRVLLEVRASNAVAVSLYRDLGFKLDGTRKGYYPAAILGGCSEDAQLYSLAIR